MLEIDGTKLVYLDEAGLKLGIDRKYAYSEKGQRAYASKWEIGAHYTLVGGLTFTGFIAPLILDGYMDGDAFIAYVEQFLVPALTPGQTVVMDRLSAHLLPSIESLIIQAQSCPIWNKKGVNYWK